jgi:CBS domain-containing protein
MIVKDVMTKKVAVCRPETTLAAASRLMRENDCGSLPLIAAYGKLAGVLTDRDICLALSEGGSRASEFTARDIAGKHAVYCYPSDDVRLALKIMGEAKVRRLPVAGGDGVLQGIVSIGDIVRKAESRISPSDLLFTLRGIYMAENSRANSLSAA